MAKDKVKFEVRQFFDEENRLATGIFIDDEHFDWGVDEENFKDAKERAMKMDPMKARAFALTIQESIERHFLESLSEFMGRRVTAEEVNEATRTGLIDK